MKIFVVRFIWYISDFHFKLGRVIWAKSFLDGGASQSVSEKILFDSLCGLTLFEESILTYFEKNPIL